MAGRARGPPARAREPRAAGRRCARACLESLRPLCPRPGHRQAARGGRTHRGSALRAPPHLRRARRPLARRARPCGRRRRNRGRDGAGARRRDRHCARRRRLAAGDDRAVPRDRVQLLPAVDRSRAGVARDGRARARVRRLSRAGWLAQAAERARPCAARRRAARGARTAPAVRRHRGRSRPGAARRARRAAGRIRAGERLVARARPARRRRGGAHRRGGLMRALHLDFLHPAGPRFQVGVALLALGVVAAILVGWRYYSLARDVADLEARLADVKHLERRDMPRMRVSPGDAKVLAQEVGRANAVLASLALPWDAMFGELEAAANTHVGLLAIHPEAGGRQVRLTGEARSFDELLAYMTRLEATPGFANVLLATHELKPGGAERPVVFTLLADWVGRQ